MALIGEVEKTEKEEVYVSLRIDKGQKGLYPYPFRPETGNMLYNMPQKGTTVSLYMPNHDERSGMVINSIRQNTSEDMTDPSKRTFTTQHDKKLDLYPSQMKLQSKTTGTTVGLEDKDTILITSHKNINIIAKEEILLKAQVINIKAKEELNLTKGDIQSGIVESSITQSTEIDKKAKTKTQIIGTDKEEYPQIQDAPPEEKFDWGKLAGNVLGCLAIVGVATAVVLTRGTLLVGVGAVSATTVSSIATSIVFGSVLSVGSVVVGDIVNHKVSDTKKYIYSTLSGVTIGAIFGKLTIAKKFVELNKIGKIVKMGQYGSVTGAVENLTNQFIIQGNEKVNFKQLGLSTVSSGVFSAGFYAIGPYLENIPLFKRLGNMIEDVDYSFYKLVDSQGHKINSAMNPTVIRPKPRKSEIDEGNLYKGYEAQKSYLERKEVRYGKKDSTRPDEYRKMDGFLHKDHSVEIKNYNLSSKGNRDSLVYKVNKQILDRFTNLPKGAWQTIVIDTRGQNVPKSIQNEISTKIFDFVEGKDISVRVNIIFKD